MNHLRWRETNLVGSRVQAAAKSEILCRLRFSSDIPSINSDCRGAEKLEFDCHLFVSNEHFIHFRRDAFGSQDISYQLYCCGMRRAVRHIQDFDFHSSLSLRGFSLKIGQCAFRLRSSLLQPRSPNRTRREGGGCLWKSRSDFQGSVGALSASMAPAASRALQARQLTRRHLHGHSLILYHERWQAKLL